ncbi:hypothetical protein C2E21_7076 [Chlorella sorokiniana]|uniref:Uncharacterized protein n=1 Tax=Chlorella sorokiniana TaxID=3076 RepID=A0A2P6TJD6_CHLSO|nr:hypothetical protein C2E21_7076 [Chlorella sorokiniana]|eukprot:PRW39322.1 hypothetical protein C2E21_7076 [Chlorella sorokiniana]
MPRLLLLLAALLACTALSGAATRDKDDSYHLKPINTLGRKLMQTDAVCCLFGNNGNPPECSQQDVNSPDARNTSQSGLVNVNGVYVNLGCIQVVANVQACVTIGTLIAQPTSAAQPATTAQPAPADTTTATAQPATSNTNTATASTLPVGDTAADPAAPGGTATDTTGSTTSGTTGLVSGVTSDTASTP